MVEGDSTTSMPFVYIINKANGNGTMSDNNGRFVLSCSPDDTIICSYIGFFKLVAAVRQLPRDSKGEVKLVMTAYPVSLQPVTVSAFRIRPYEREYMNDIIDRSRIKLLDYGQSPITALYMRFSKEGRQVRKLARIFEDLLIEEQVQKKLSREILVRLTGDEKIDYAAFRKYCYYVDDQFIVSHDGAELYSRVMDCYRSYKKEMGR
ncbi:MAG TPA: hypothetical protein VEB42_15470 [Chitinophagaceae bacterium]|nr:hypothetical protein [Chitinophagaceae bacterium]